MSDTSSIREYIKGNNKQFESLYNEYLKQMYSYGLSLGFSKEICMDAIHDVFYKLCVLKSEEVNKIENLKSYLLISLKNRLFDLYKKNRKITPLDNHNLLFTLEISTENISHDLIKKEEAEALQLKVEALLSSLTDRQKEAVYLRFVQELSYDEISVLLNMTSKSARMLIYRAMERMREAHPLNMLVMTMLWCSM